MTYDILVEKAPKGELPGGFYYAHVPALDLTTHGQAVEGARAAAEDLIKLWLAEKKAAVRFARRVAPSGWATDLGGYAY
jgi:predicted RNase H-like HicB family nuclease